MMIRRMSSRRGTDGSLDSNYESADETFRDQEIEARRKRMQRRRSSIAKFVHQASTVSISAYHGICNIFTSSGTGTVASQRRRSSVRKKWGVDRHLIELVRQKVNMQIEFLCSKESLPKNQLFDPLDIEFIEGTDDLITRFLLEYFEDHPSALKNCQDEIIATDVANCVMDTLKWRKENNVNQLKDSDFPRDFYEANIFLFGKDSDGADVVYVRGRFCRKIASCWSPILISFIIHECEKKLKEILGDPRNPKNPGHRPGILIDCSNVAVTQLDTSLIFSLLPFVKHYPQSFEYAWVYELPWMMRPFFNLVIKMLPTRIVRKVKQMDKKSAIKEMGIEGLPSFLGGKSPIEPTIQVPPGASTLDEVAKRHNISDDDIRKFREFLKKIHSEL